MDAIEQTGPISKPRVQAGKIDSNFPSKNTSLIRSDVRSFAENVADVQIPTRSLSTKEEKAISEYTSIITTQFIGAILDEQSSIFDSGDGASKHYHTIMVEAVSDQLTSTDALGLKSIIQWEISKW